MENFYNKHYIRLNADGHIIKGFSDAFEQPQYGDILINEQGGYQFRLFSPYGEENTELHDDYGVPLYKYVGGEVIGRTDEEREADRPVPPEPPRDLQAELDEIKYIIAMRDVEAGNLDFAEKIISESRISDELQSSLVDAVTKSKGSAIKDDSKKPITTEPIVAGKS